jgi:hypothetical protein
VRAAGPLALVCLLGASATAIATRGGDAQGDYIRHRVSKVDRPLTRT